MAEFNIRQFYKDTIAQEERSLSEATGLEIRHQFQQYNTGSGKEMDLFIVKTPYKECFGLEFGGAVSYFFPIDREDILIFIFDKQLMPIINHLAEWSESRLQMVTKYLPSIINGAKNASKGDFRKFCFYVEDDSVCIAKRIYYPLLDKLDMGYIVEPELLTKIVELLKYRNQCVEELVAFKGFTTSDESKIALKEGFSLLKKGLRILNFSESMLN